MKGLSLQLNYPRNVWNTSFVFGVTFHRLVNSHHRRRNTSWWGRWLLVHSLKAPAAHSVLINTAAVTLNKLHIAAKSDKLTQVVLSKRKDKYSHVPWSEEIYLESFKSTCNPSVKFLWAFKLNGLFYVLLKFLINRMQCRRLSYLIKVAYIVTLK